MLQAAERLPRSYGFAPLWVVVGSRPVGRLLRVRRKLLRKPLCVIEDRHGTRVGVVTPLTFLSGPTGESARFLSEVQQPVEHPVRLATLVAGVIWDWHTMRWEADG